MGEKRKARMTNNERTSKKEKKTINSVTPSASNDDIEEQSSMHSNSSNSDGSSQQPSVTQEVVHSEEIEESQMITPIDVEHVSSEKEIEPPSVIPDDDQKITEPAANTKSWWSSLARLFHFGSNSSTESKSASDHPSTTYIDGGSYLGNVKCRRSLHGDSLVG